MAPTTPRSIVYPETDGKPIADNTLQFDWIVTIHGGLTVLFADRPDVFVAADLLWYPIEGDNRTRTAPDAMVAIGRPRGHRRSYLQWEEGGIAPQVVFEILSPEYGEAELTRKFQFYERFGVLEYYIYDPDHNKLEGWLRPGVDQPFSPIAAMAGWTSPHLAITFDWTPDRLHILRPNGRPFETYREAYRRAYPEEARTEAERRGLAALRRRTNAELRLADAKRQADAEHERAERLLARLRELGEDL